MKPQGPRTRFMVGRVAQLVAASGWVLAGVALAHAAPHAKGTDNGAKAAEGGASQVRPYELQLFGLINEERKRHGVRALKLSRKLSRVARRHSQEMRDRGYLGHISPIAERSTPRKRYRKAFDDEPYLIGENVARRAGAEWCLSAERMEKTHRGLMDSRHHRENMIRPEFEQVGIGIAINESGHYWVTELFVCVPAPEENASTE